MDNAQKNQYVKTQITNALLRLLEAYELNDLSVSQITEAAQVNRVSFYRNYESKEDILKQYVHQQLRGWQDRYDAEHPAEDGIGEMFGSLFRHFKEHEAFYLLLNKRGLSSIILDSIKRICGPKPEHSNLEAYFAGFMSYGIFGWIDEWFARGMSESADAMAILLKGSVGDSEHAPADKANG